MIKVLDIENGFEEFDDVIGKITFRFNHVTDDFQRWFYDENGNNLEYENSEGWSEFRTYNDAGFLMTYDDCTNFAFVYTRDENNNVLTLEFL